SKSDAYRQRQRLYAEAKAAERELLERQHAEELRKR
ncbi:MAG: hypothetical protein JWM72_3792, partial [Actinomycetia bacterium]|nr:hypothetical protein [Actinomycetes bacterium]